MTNGLLSKHHPFEIKENGRFDKNNKLMAAVKLLDKEIVEYLGQLSLQQKEVVLSVVKTFAGEDFRWEDKAFIEEMDKRFADLESGKVNGITLEQLESGARQSYKSRKHKNA